jgi:hypothetical protein
MQNKQQTQEDDKEFREAIEPLAKAITQAFVAELREDGIRRILAKSKNQK